MANIPQNESYSNTNTTPLKTTGSFKYAPRTTYKNLTKFAPAPTPVVGTPEYEMAKRVGIFQYGKLLNEGLGVPTQTQFLPPTGDIQTPIPIPSGYGAFAEPMTIEEDGAKLSWGTPTSPVIKNISGDTGGQYVEDVTNPNLLVKTIRGSNSLSKQSMLNGRPSFMYQDDHIMPLSLGGADTLANRELLTPSQNFQKTTVQAIPYTLYAYGDISLTEAREMAMQWKNRDITDIPPPNDVGLVSDTDGKTGIEIAREVKQRWTQPKKETLKEKIGKIPQMAKDFGEGWLPDPVREFIKGTASGFTLGFVPYEQDEDETAGSWLAGKAGQLAGSVASFMTGSALLSGISKGSLMALRGATALRAAKTGLGTAEVVGEGVALAKGLKTAETTFKTLNKVPGYIQKIFKDPIRLANVGKMAATSALVGQGSRLVGNTFNPYVLSDQTYETDQGGITSIAGNIFTDLAMGAAYGIAPPTLKGVAYATALPTTMGLLLNPDDPMSAITDGVMFGALHAYGSRKNSNFNDIKALGGKSYKSPVDIAFEDTVNKVAYESLGYYAPDILPTLKPGGKVPTTAHSAETVQQAKDKAITNIWKRFFYGKDIPVETQKKTLEDFKGFSKDLETSIAGENIPELKGLSRLSYSARRARTATVKAQGVETAKAYGEGYQTRNEIKGALSKLSEGGMDLQTALTEIKRVTVAARQLYKGGLTAELRNKADIDDLLSFSNTQLKGRFDSMEKYSNPPIAKQAVDLIDESFMQKSFNNNRPEPSGKYPNGDIALTGAALTINKPEAVYFFKQRETGNASPNILLVDRSDTAPLWNMKNKLIDPKDIELKNYAIDLNPENALQAFGVVKNPKTGSKELVPLGWVASDFRLNLATGKGHEAFNQHPLVKKWQETSGAEGMKPIDLHKDQLASVMKKEGIDVLVANLDPKATVATVESGNPFIPVNVNDLNWTYSKTLGDRLSQQGNKNPISMDIAKINSTLDAKQKSVAISEMNKKIDKPAVEYIPKPVSSGDPKTDRIIVPQSKTIDIVQDITDSINVLNPMGVKESFKKNFNILLTDQQATEIFDRRYEVTMKDGIKMLEDAVKSGNTDARTKFNLTFVNTYLNSGALEYSPNGKAVEDMLLLGGMKNRSYGGQEEHLMTPDKSVRAAEPITPVQEPVTTPTQTTNGLPDRMITHAQRELPNIIKKVKTIPYKQDSSIESAKAITEEEMRQNRNINEDQSRYSSQSGFTPEDFARTEWQRINNSKIPEKKYEKRQIIQKIAIEIEKNFPSMEIEQAIGFANRALPELSGASGEYIKTPISKPGSLPGEYSSWIKKGLATPVTENPGAHYLAKAFDKGLKDMLGPNYNKNPKLARVLDDYFKNVFFNEKNLSGREITQPMDILKARATGERSTEGAAIEARKKILTENQSIDTAGLTNAEIENLGLLPEEGGFSGMAVKPWFQEENMVRDLTYGEDLMGALFADVPQGAATSVRAVKKLFLGGQKGTGGLRQYIIERIPSAKRFINFDDMVNEAVATDAKYSVKAITKKAKIEEAKEQLPILKQQIEFIQKAIEDPQERANWQTPELLETNYKEIFDRIKKYNDLIEETKDGGGGPGFYDGKGGLGDVVVGNLWGSNLKSNLGTEKPISGNVPVYKNLKTPIIKKVGDLKSNLWGNLKKTFSNKSFVTENKPTTPIAKAKGGFEVPKEYVSAVSEASKHTTIPEDIVIQHLNAENGSVWIPTLKGYADPTDFGISQLNPKGVAAITGKQYVGERNYFKDNYGRDFDPNSGIDQILGYGVLMNRYKQFDLPALGIKNPTLKDQMLAYNMGPEDYVTSLQPNALPELITKRERYLALLKRNGINLK
jgi:hypothetical protein